MKAHFCRDKAEQSACCCSQQLYPVGLTAQVLNFIAPWFVVRHKEQHGKKGIKMNERVCIWSKQSLTVHSTNTRLVSLFQKEALLQTLLTIYNLGARLRSCTSHLTHTYLFGAPLQRSILPGTSDAFMCLSHVFHINLNWRVQAQGTTNTSWVRPEGEAKAHQVTVTGGEASGRFGTDETAEQCVVRSWPQSCAELLLCGGW